MQNHTAAAVVVGGSAYAFSMRFQYSATATAPLPRRVGSNARKVVDVGIAFGLDQERKAADASRRKLAQLPGKIAGVARVGLVIGQYVYGHSGILAGCG